ncbi:MAG: DsrE family protein [Nitrospiraceae bacterium]|nr:DsrE family protein [Nitrospirota bacterium]MDA8340298.1 DsrE family protein [Nitrospiraceae bacterium]
MGSIGIILRRPPYGTVDAPEAIRHALGGIIEDMAVKLILVDGGVNAAKKGQDTSNTEYSSIESGIRDCIDMGADVYADKTSIKDEHLENDDIIDGVIIANSSEIAEIINESDTTMIF